ncbi:MAG TPA: hypothetical protein VK576_04170, partial [Thermoleophilia bacterium]|nr:hypothetical protein [Thermoleophilia bacterium]
MLQRITLGYWLLVLPMAVAGVLMIVTVAAVQGRYMKKENSATSVRNAISDFRYDLVSQQAFLQALLTNGDTSGTGAVEARTGLLTLTSYAGKVGQAVLAAEAASLDLKTFAGYQRDWEQYQQAAQKALAAAKAGRSGT